MATIAPVLEESKSFVSPDPNQTFHRERLHCAQRLGNTAHPSRHLTRGVDVVGLDVLCEVLLGHDEELYHGVC